MSDEMMFGIAKMSYEMAMGDEMSRRQFYANTQRLVAALEGAWEDAERLDWLEEQAQISRTGVSINYVYDAEDGYVNEKGYRFMRHHFIGPLGKSMRKAIDAARRAEEDEE